MAGRARVAKQRGAGMKHHELIDLGGAVKYEGQEVPEWN